MRGTLYEFTVLRFLAPHGSPGWAQIHSVTFAGIRFSLTDSIVSQGQLSQDEFVDKATEDSKMIKSVLTNIFERRMTSIAH